MKKKKSLRWFTAAAVVLTAGTIFTALPSAISATSAPARVTQSVSVDAISGATSSASTPARVKQLAPDRIKKNSLRVRWKKVKGAKSYQVSWRKIRTSGKASGWKIKKSIGKKRTSLTLKNLSANTKYQIRVRAVGRKNRTGKWSKIRTVRTAPKLQLGQVQITEAKACGLVKIRLSWQAVSNASKYQIAIRRKGRKSWETDTVSAASTSAEFEYSLSASRTYQVRIRAKSGKVSGAWSKTAEFTTLSEDQIHNILTRFLDSRVQGSYRSENSYDWTNPGSDYSEQTARLVLDHYGLGNNGMWYGYSIGDGAIVKQKKQQEVYNYFITNFESVNNETDMSADAAAFIASNDATMQGLISTVDTTISNNQDIIDRALMDETFLEIPDLIDIMNQDRADTSNAYGAAAPVKIDYNMTADAIYNLAYMQQRLSDNADTPHCSFLSGLWSGQCLAWGYDNPFDGWYNEEKELYDGGNRTYSEIGHYLNVIDTSATAVGFMMAGSTSILNTGAPDSLDYAVTPEEFRQALQSEVYPQLGY